MAGSGRHVPACSWQNRQELASGNACNLSVQGPAAGSASRSMLSMLARSAAAQTGWCRLLLLLQDRLFPAVPSDQASLYSRPASKGMRGMGASYDFGSRDHIFEQGLM